MINISVIATESLSGKAASEVDSIIYGCTLRMAQELRGVAAADVLSVTFDSDVTQETDTFYPKEFT